MPFCRLPFPTLLLGFLLVFLSNASAVIRDGGIDTKNMGKGTWIYILPNAINGLGGNVPSVNSLSNLMTYMKDKGVQYVTIKAAQSDSIFTVSGNTQFTPAVVEAGHSAGLKVFGYIYTTGENVPGEIAMCNWIFQQGADGLVYDAESEWEPTTNSTTHLPNHPWLTNATAQATQLSFTVRSNWPNKFMGLSTWPYRGVHTTLPYKEFAYNCDVIMPQAYWIELGDTPTACVTRMNNEWNTWKNGLSGIWTNAIKPFVVSGQGWTSASGTITPAQIAEFENALKTIANPVSPGGFKATDYWRAELHPANLWQAFVTNVLANPYTNPPVIQYVPVVVVGPTNATITWPTDQVSDSAAEYGLTAAYGSATTNNSLAWYHTLNLSGLSPDTTYHFRVKSKGTNNLIGLSLDYVFTTASTTVSDIIIDQDPANNSGGDTIAYTGSWVGNTASGLAYQGTFRYANPSYTALGSPTSTARFTPNIVTAGNYDVYAQWTASSVNGNRAINAPYRIFNGTTTTVRINQEANGGSFQLLASGKFFEAGTAGYVELGNDVTMGTGGDICVADAVKFVYVPPAPTKPSIATQPLAQTVNQGNSATFSVVAGGTAPLTYQWKHAGTNLPGATTSSYVKLNVQPADAGNYSVGITNGIGFSNSANAMLSVIVPPAITQQPQGTNVSAGSTATFTVTATGTAPLKYQWQFNTADIAGATASSYAKTNVQASDAGAYSVVVSNAAGVVTSDDAMLTLLQPLTPAHIDFITLLPGGDVRLQVSANPGHYAIDGATNLTGSPLDWIELTNFSTSTNPFDYTHSPGGLSQRFYRVRSLP